MSANGAGFGHRGSARTVARATGAAAPASDSGMEKALIGGIAGVFALFLLVWFVPPVHAAFATIAKPFGKFFDSRPVQTVLIIGSNRTVQHDLADMIEDIGKSANAPVRYSVSSKTGKDVSFKTHWESSGVQSALKNHWDHVIIQGEIDPRKKPEMRRNFSEFGQKILLAAQATKSQPAVLVSPGYGDIFYTKYPTSKRNDVRTKNLTETQVLYRALSANTESGLINVLNASEMLRVRDPKLMLYESEDSPSIAGSYMAALMIYKYLSHSWVSNVTYVPPGLNPAVAAAIREVVNNAS